MASRLSIERKERIAAIRAAALRLVEQDGQWQEMARGPGPGLWLAQCGELEISLREPVEGLPELPEEVREALSAASALPPEYEYSLDIWTREGKVMFLAWEDAAGTDLKVVSFRRGDWETKLLEMARVH